MFSTRCPVTKLGLSNLKVRGFQIWYSLQGVLHLLLCLKLSPSFVIALSHSPHPQCVLLGYPTYRSRIVQIFPRLITLALITLKSFFFIFVLFYPVLISLCLPWQLLLLPIRPLMGSHTAAIELFVPPYYASNNY